MTMAIFDYETKDQVIPYKTDLQRLYDFFKTYDVIDHPPLSDYDENFNGLIEYQDKLNYLDIDLITVNPKLFQFKMNCKNDTGSTGSLSGVNQWNEDLSGVILVWYNQGKIYCINGHNRLDKAKKLGRKQIAVKFIQAIDHNEARLKGALCNIAEGNGSPFDVAKVFKDSNLTKNDLIGLGIKLNNKLADQGLSLSNLSDHLFDQTLRGDIPLNYSVYAGKLDQALQYDFIKLCIKRNNDGNIPDHILKELLDMSQRSEVNQGALNLFGADHETYILERADLISYINKRLKQDKTLFKTVSINKERLKQGNNLIDQDTSQDISVIADHSINLFNQFKNLNCGISNLLTGYAKKLKLSQSKDSALQVKGECFICIYHDLEKLIKNKDLKDNYSY
jgi:hypothetical protein